MEEVAKTPDLTQEEEQKDIRPVTLKLITGGKGSDGNDPNWLKSLPIGQTFLIQDRHSQDFNLGLCRLGEYTDKYAVIFFNVPNGQPISSFVNPTRFCNKYIHVENLNVVPEEQEENADTVEEETNQQIKDTQE